jgi:hypothetical protein
MEVVTMNLSDQRSVRAAPEKVTVRESRRNAMAVGGAIRDSLRGAIAGTSLHARMT